MKLNAVNVIEYADDTILGVTSFEDNDAGNKEAETLFMSFIKQNSDATTEDIEVALEDGFYEQGNYQVFITHSN